jgi:hypothetical protein
LSAARKVLCHDVAVVHDQESLAPRPRSTKGIYIYICIMISKLVPQSENTTDMMQKPK